MSVLPPSFRPRGAATGVGGMPQADLAACVDAAVTACPALPFWPTRPLAVPAERMIDQWALGLPGVGEGAPDRGGLAWLGRERAPGRAGLAAAASGTLDRLLQVLGPRPAGWLKLQATGPVTLALELRAGARPVFELPAARGPLALGYAARIRSVVTRVREALPAWRVLLVLDEPSLASPAVAERPELAVELWRGLGATGAELTGLHCCATPPWGLVLDIDPQLVSFDAINHGDAATDDPAFRRLVESGAAVAWGLVPADGAPAGVILDPEEIADRLLDLVEWTAGDDLAAVLARSVVTPTCGLASLSDGEAVRRLELAAKVGPIAWDLAELP